MQKKLPGMGKRWGSAQATAPWSTGKRKERAGARGAGPFGKLQANYRGLFCFNRLPCRGQQPDYNAFNAVVLDLLHMEGHTVDFHVQLFAVFGNGVEAGDERLLLYQ